MGKSVMVVVVVVRRWVHRICSSLMVVGWLSRWLMWWCCHGGGVVVVVVVPWFDQREEGRIENCFGVCIK